MQPMRRIVVALSALLLLPSVLAAEPNARAPDITVDHDVTALALAGEDGALLIGTDDPGPRLQGAGSPSLGADRDAVVWQLRNASGGLLQDGPADYRVGNNGCDDRVGDDCRSPVVAAQVADAGDIAVVVSRIASSPQDAHLGQVLLIGRGQGVVDRAFVDFTPTHARLSGNGSILVVAGTVPGITAQTGRVAWMDVEASTLRSLRVQDLAVPVRSLALARDGSEAVVAADGLQRLFYDVATVQGHTGPTGAVTAVDMAAGDPYWAVAGYEGGRIVLARHNQTAAAWQHSLGAEVTAVASEDGAIHFAAGSADGRVHLVRRAGSGSAVASVVATLDLGESPVTGLSWSRDGSILVASAGDRVHLLRRTATGFVPVWADQAGGTVTAIAADGAAGYVAAAWGNKVRVYEAVTALAVEAPTLSMRPGDQENITITYRNTGNRPLVLGLDVQGPAAWQPSLSKKALSLDEGRNGTVGLHLHAPPGHAPGDVAFRVNHTLADGTTGAATVRVFVPEVARLSMAPVGPDSLDIAPGSFSRFLLRVENQGNARAVASLEVEAAPEGWHADLRPASPSLGPGREANVTVQLEAPGDAAQGDRGTATVRFGDEPPVVFTGTVGARFAMRLHAPANLDVERGGTTPLRLEVENAGNAPDSYRLALDPGSPPEGWNVGFEGGLRSMELRGVAPGARAGGTVHVQVPADAPLQGVLNVKVEAASLTPDGPAEARTVVLDVVGGPAPPTDDTPGAGAAFLLVALAVCVWLRRRP